MSWSPPLPVIVQLKSSVDIYQRDVSPTAPRFVDRHSGIIAITELGAASKCIDMTWRLARLIVESHGSSECHHQSQTHHRPACLSGAVSIP